MTTDSKFNEESMLVEQCYEDTFGLEPSVRMYQRNAHLLSLYSYHYSTTYTVVDVVLRGGCGNFFDIATIMDLLTFQNPK